ncbi:hypothetical protein [Dyella sp.]|uniref:hypothetical protein n=1 Tax=Dyella sp. TaxID=1869338 RepID=UPI003F7D995D
MLNEITLLESLGSNAALRYATTSQLAQRLDEEQVSEVFREAAINADGASLRRALAANRLPVTQNSTQISQIPWCDEGFAVQTTQMAWREDA